MVVKHSLEHFPDQTTSFQKDTAFLSNQVLWHEGSRGVPEFFKGGYSFSEVIGKSGYYHHDFRRLRLFIQAASIDYPAHAHEAEECHLILNGQVD